ncbi:O-antigen ligase family protein [Luteimonas suaedae]|uniref:O-antigen ligase family protein n=1 Tax=Luteimonas suaedae TaxID=2605430 RepID=UPI001659BE8C|nr:O-antigen ligase family protein [Luteimonas suaedae]
MFSFNKYSVPLFCIALIPLWWLLGFGFFVFHASSLYIALLLRRAMIPRDGFQIAVLGVSGILALSLAYNTAVFDIDLSRTVAALHNISVMLVGYCHYTYFKLLYQMDDAWVARVSRVLWRLCAISILLAVPLSYAVFSGKLQVLGIPTLLGFVLPPMDNLLGLYLKAEFVARDWFGGGDMPRLKILATNATASAGLIAISGFIAAGFAMTRYRWLMFAFLGLVLLTIAATLTRAALLGALLGVMVIALAVIRKQYYLLVFAGAPLVLGAALIFLPDMLAEVNDMREGSSNARFIAYQASFDEAMRVNPLIGLGVKPRVNDLAIPIGSHSTLFSTLVRGGGLGAAAAFIAFFLFPIVKGGKLALKLMRRSAAFGCMRPYAIAALGGLPSFIVYCTFQDIDVYTPITVVFFTYMAGLIYWANVPSSARRPVAASSG